MVKIHEDNTERTLALDRMSLYLNISDFFSINKQHHYKQGLFNPLFRFKCKQSTKLNSFLSSEDKSNQHALSHK